MEITKRFMTEGETCCVGESHVCYCKPDQKPGPITSPRGYSTEIIALNECAVKLVYLIFMFRCIGLCRSQPGSGKLLFALNSR